MGRNGSYQLNVPTLSGGVNASADPTMIADNELAAVQNLRWKNGVLRKRQAVRTVDLAPFEEIAVARTLPLHVTADGILSHPIDVDGELSTIIHSGAQYGTPTTTGACSERVRVISLDGEVKATYQLPKDYQVQDAAFAPCDKAKYGCSFLMYRGNRVFKPDDTTGMMVAVPDNELYAPLVMINGKSTVNEGDAENGVTDGVMYEGFNLLTRRYRARFTTQGGNGKECFKLPTALKSGSSVEIELVTASGTVTFAGEVGKAVETESYKVDAKTDGKVFVYPCPPKSLVADNLTITATAAAASEESVAGATLATWFGGTQNKLGGTRLFLSGFAGDKAKVMWSDVGNPLYFPENNYMFVGDLSQRVTALEKQGAMLVIFKERELYYTTYVQGEIDADSVANGTNVDVTAAQAYFPLTQLSPYIGCDAPHSIAVCHDRLVWLCADGRVYTLAEGSQYSERNVREIGQKIHPLTALHSKEHLTRASAMDYDGCYTVLIGNTAYSFDYSDSGFAAATSYYSGERAARSIAWYVHRFEAFASYETLRLVSDGAYRAILISTQTRTAAFTHIRMLYRFVDEARDNHANIMVSGMDGSDEELALNTSITDHPVSASLTTKAYDFGDIRRFKRIAALFLAAEGEDIRLRFVADGEASAALRSVGVNGQGGRLVLPGVKRCRTFAVKLETDAPLKLLGLRLQYTPFGTVR